MIKTGHTKRGVQRYQCKTCGKTFTETTGTLFFRKRTPEHEILETLVLLAEGSRISSLSRAKGFKEDTILAWLREAAQHQPPACLHKAQRPSFLAEPVMGNAFEFAKGQCQPWNLWKNSVSNMSSCIINKMLQRNRGVAKKFYIKSTNFRVNFSKSLD
jgi:hypothetical protein